MKSNLSNEDDSTTYNEVPVADLEPSSYLLNICTKYCSYLGVHLYVTLCLPRH